MANENTQTHYQEEVFVLILHQILVTNLQRIVKQQEERINNQILGVKGLRRSVKLITRCFLFPMDTAPIDQALEHADDVENLKKLRQLGGEGASHKLFVIVPLILSLALNSFLSFHNG